MNNDTNEDLFEDFDFKPITKGLGFHHSLQESSQVKTDLSAQSESLKRDLEMRSEKVLSDSINLNKTKAPNMGELAPFYEDSEKPFNKAPKLSDKLGDQIEVRFHNASTSYRAMAFMIDVIVVSSMFILCLGSILLFAEFPFSYLDKMMISNDILVSFIALYLMFYTFYFTFLDKTEHSSFGKKMMGIKVVTSLESKNISLLNSFYRTLLSFVSIISLGIFSLLSLDSSMTNTRVVQK